MEEEKRMISGKEPEQKKKETKKKPFKVKVSIPNLYARTGPGKAFKDSGFMPIGEFTIAEEKNGYGRVEENDFWICLEYAEKL